MDNVQVSIKHISDVEKEIFVSIDAEMVSKQYDVVCNMLNSQIEIKGFRKGKVPKEILMQKYKDKIKSMVDTNLINIAFGESINENGFELIGSPDVKEVNHEVDGSYNVSMHLEVKPKFDPQGYLGMHLDKAPEINMDEALEKRFNTFKMRGADFIIVDRASRSGDRVKVSFSGFLDGKDFEGSKIEDAEFELGSGNMLEEFEQVITGMSAGEEKDAPVTFPEDYRNKELANQEVTFHVVVSEVAEKKLPEIDDDLAKKFGFGSIDRMKEKFTEEITNEHDHTIRCFYEDQIVQNLIDANSFSIPPTLISKQVEHILSRMKQHFGYDDKPNEELQKSINAMADQQLRKMIMLDAIFQKEADNMKDVGSYAEIVERLARFQNITKDEFIKMFQDDPGNLAIKVREENVIDFILSKAEIE